MNNQSIIIKVDYKGSKIKHQINDTSITFE